MGKQLVTFFCEWSNGLIPNKHLNSNTHIRALVLVFLLFFYIYSDSSFEWNSKIDFLFSFLCVLKENFDVGSSVEKCLEISGEVFILKLRWRFRLEVGLGAVPKNTKKGKEATNAAKAVGRAGSPRGGFRQA